MPSSATGSIPSNGSKKSNKKKRHSTSGSLSTTPKDSIDAPTTATATATTTTTTTTTSIKVKVVESNPLNDPIVCSFPGGVPTSVIQHQKQRQSKNPLTFQWYKKKNQRSFQSDNDVEYVLKGQDEACQYYGSCISSPSQSSHTTKLCVGIYDKQTNIVTFYPTAGNGAVISLQQFVPSYHQGKAAQNDIDIDSDGVNGTSHPQRSSLSSNALLYTDFGSAKKRRVLQSQEANRVTVDAVVGDTTTTTTNNDTNDHKKTINNTAFHNPIMSESNRSAMQHQQQINMALLAVTSRTNTESTTAATTTPMMMSSIHLAAELATSNWRQTFLPPYNTLATKASQIYNVATIAGPTLWNTILPNLLQKIRFSNSETTSSSIIQYLNRCNSSTTNHSHQQHQQQSNIVIYCTEIVSDVLNTSTKYHHTYNESSSQFFKSTMLLNYFICLYIKFQQQKFRMPALFDKVDDDDDNDDNDDDDDLDLDSDAKPKASSSFRYKLYGNTPIMVLQRFFELFTSSLSTTGSSNNDGNKGGHHQNHTKCVMSRAQQDKCLVHIFVLYIMSSTLMNGQRSSSKKNDNDDTSIVIHDVMPLLNELQLSDKINHGVLLLREAGCIVTRVSSASTKQSQQKKIKIELSVPLTFPKMKKKQRS